MISRIVLLSGGICAGKSTLASALRERHDFRLIKTHELISHAVGWQPGNRKEFQDAGDLLDAKTDGQWIQSQIMRMQSDLPDNCAIVIDAIRIQKQIDHLRDAFGSRVFHIHLTAPPQRLSRRYDKRAGNFKEFKTYKDAQRNRTEANIESLQDKADILIDTDRCSGSEVLVRVVAHLGLLGLAEDRLVDVLVGGQYGSEGKGQVAAHLASGYDVLLRVGGPNAGHTVFAVPEPYKYRHLPSGTKHNESAKIVLGPGAVIDENLLLEEIAKHEVAVDRLTIDPNAMLIEVSDMAFETKHLRESIASTASGVGAATSRKILRSAAKPPVRLAGASKLLKAYVRDSREIIGTAFREGQRILLEGTQGTGLSIHHGSYPWVTSRDTTVSGCLAEAGISPTRVRKVVMVCRTYPIRVGGNSGPLRKDLTWAEISRRSGIAVAKLRKAERTTNTNTLRRPGEFEWGLLRTAAELNSPTDIALTFSDYIDIKNRSARRFDQLTQPTILFIEEIERVAMAPVSLISTHFGRRSIIDRRIW